jgi:hypothetical protein
MQAFEDSYTDDVNTRSKEIKSQLENKSTSEDDLNAKLQEYADLQGMTLDEVKAAIEDKSLSTDTIANALATKEVDKKVKAAMEGSVKVLTEKTSGKSKREIA